MEPFLQIPFRHQKEAVLQFSKQFGVDVSKALEMLLNDKKFNHHFKEPVSSRFYRTEVAALLANREFHTA